MNSLLIPAFPDPMIAGNGVIAIGIVRTDHLVHAGPSLILARLVNLDC